MSYINEIVNVNAFYFAGRQQRMFPRQIELGGVHYNFLDGLQYIIKRGQTTFQMFDMTDGEKTYRLRCENSRWVLIGMR
jgi:hypothetical protein